MPVADSFWSDLLRPSTPSADAVRALAPGSTVMVYGAGSAAQDVIAILRRRGVTVRGVLDAKSDRKEIGGISVQRPGAASWSAEQKAATPVIIGVFNAFADIAGIVRDLTRHGWARTIDFPELHAILPEEIGDRYWLTRRDFLARHVDSIAAVDTLWADETSRASYRGLLHFRATGDRSRLPTPDTARQYFAADVPPWTPPLRLVDCGACDGDTVRQIAALELPLQAIAAFEPDPKNFARLADELAGLSRRGIEALGWPCGVAEQTRQLRFRGNAGAGSALDAAGDLVVQCVALDEALGGFNPTLIKMDIEGAERDALTGARLLIERHRPGLAVCVYHRPADLWELPGYVAALQLGYRLYLRCHQFSDFDVVLYAVPPAA